MPDTYVTDYTAMTNGYSRWNAAAPLGTAVTIAYTFLTGDDIPTAAEHSPFMAGDTTNYLAMDSVRQAATRLALAEFSSVSGVQFIEVDDPALANIHLLSNQVSGGGYSWAYSPYSYAGYSGDATVTMTEDDMYHYDSDWDAGGWAFNLALHELGHAMGLDHPHEGTLLDPSLDNHNYTLMSYDWSWDGSVAPDYPNRFTLAPLDVDALEYLYGADTFGDLGWVTLWDETTDTFTLTGEATDDVLIGLRADSLLNGGNGADTLYGQAGDDTLNGGSNADRMIGGDGDDTYRVNSVHDVIIETYNQGADLIETFITARLEDYSYYVENLRLMGTGNLNGTGDDGANAVTGNNGANILNGGLGNDTLEGGTGADTLRGQGDADALYGGNDADHLSGGAGSDLLNGGAGQDTLKGGTGNDTVLGAMGNDSLNGSAGSDFINGGTGSDTMFGGAGFDTLVGGDGADVIDGGLGLDLIGGGGGNDSINGNTGSDTVSGGLGADTIAGQGGNDVLNGGGGNDFISGGLNQDTLAGEGGNDTLNGGAGNDALFGGTGADDFVFDGVVGVDVVQDWQNNVDDLNFSNLAEISSLSDFNSAASNVGSNLLIELAGYSQITILNASEAQFDVTDFIF